MNREAREGSILSPEERASSAPLNATTAALALPGCPSSHTRVWTPKRRTGLFAVDSFHALINPFDLLMPPPIYSARALQPKGVTSSFIVLP